MVGMCGILSLTSLLLIIVYLFSKSKSDIAQAIKYSGYLNRILLLLLLINDEREILFLKWEWVKLGGYRLTVSFRYDIYTCCFFVVALYVT